MNNSFLRTVYCVIFLSLFLSNYALGDITGVTRIGTSANCEPTLGGTLNEGSTAYCDQLYTWTNMPPEADGALIDYIVVSDGDNSVGDYGLSITVDLPGVLLLFIDPAIDVGADMAWVIDDGYLKEEDINFTLDQGGPTVVFDLWTLEVENPANPIVTGPQNNGNFNNYGVAYGTDAADLVISIVDDPDPYIIGSGVNWTRTYTVENLGQSDTDNIVMSGGFSGINDFTFVSLVTSPNSNFNVEVPNQWQIPVLESGESATLAIAGILGPDQAVGTDVITTNAQIDSSDIFDPDLSNNSTVETSSVLAIESAVTGVTRTGTSVNCEPTLGGTLINGSTAYCDQSYTWTNIPPEADGEIIDYIVVSDADRSVEDYGLSITVSLPGALLLFIDPGIDVGTDMTWVINDGYEKEDGINFTLDQGGPAVVFDLWVREIEDPANPIVTGPQNNGDFNNYGVAYVIDAADLAISIVDDPDPYVRGSEVNWTRTYTIENLGQSDTDNILVLLSGSGITDRSFVSRVPSPPSYFEPPNKWHIPVLESGDSATLTVALTLGPDQAVGVDVITLNAQIDTSDTFDPDLTNNSAVETTSVLRGPDENVIHEDSFEDP